MKLILEKGSPADISGRLPKEQRCYQLLDELGLEYYRCDHPDANADTMEACLAIDAILEATVCKNLFLCNRQQTQFYLLMMPGEKVFKTKELSGQLGCASLRRYGLSHRGCDYCELCVVFSRLEDRWLHQGQPHFLRRALGFYYRSSAAIRYKAGITRLYWHELHHFYSAAAIPAKKIKNSLLEERSQGPFLFCAVILL